MTLQDWAALTAIVTFATGVSGFSVGWIRSHRRRARLKRIAELREAGVKLRNWALLRTNITSADDLGDWTKRRDVWKREARDAVKNLAAHEAISFETIGTLLQEDHVAGEFTVNEQEREVSFMTADLRRLEEIRRRYSTTA